MPNTPALHLSPSPHSTPSCLSGGAGGGTFIVVLLLVWALLACAGCSSDDTASEIPASASVLAPATDPDAQESAESDDNEPLPEDELLSDASESEDSNDNEKDVPDDPMASTSALPAEERKAIDAAILELSEEPAPWAEEPGQTVLSFYDARLLLHWIEDGPVVEFGDASGVKFVRGRWGSTWSPSIFISEAKAIEDKLPELANRRVANLLGTKAGARVWFSFPVPADMPRDEDYVLMLKLSPRGLNNLIDIRWNGEPLSSVPLQLATWQRIRVKVPASRIKFGDDNTITFAFTSTAIENAERIAARFDYMRFTPASRAKPDHAELPPPTDLAVPEARVFAAQKRALGLPSPSRLDAYVIVPPKGRFRFYLAPSPWAQMPVEVRVMGRPEGRDPEVLFTAQVEPAQPWRPYEVHLGRFAGKGLQLSILTLPNEQGSSGYEPAIYMGEPALVEQRAAPIKPIEISTSPDPVPLDIQQQKADASDASSSADAPDARSAPDTSTKTPDVISVAPTPLYGTYSNINTAPATNSPATNSPSDTVTPPSPFQDAPAKTSRHPLLPAEAQQWDRVIVVSIDGLRTDRVEGPLMGQVAPWLSWLRTQGVTFNSMAAGPGALISTSTLITGVYPPQHHVFSTAEHIPEHLDTLAQTLSIAGGWRTTFVGTSGFISIAKGFADGFQNYRNLAEEDGSSRTSRLIDIAIKDLDLNPDRKLFQYLHIANLRLPHVASPETIARFYPNTYSGPINEASQVAPETITAPLAPQDIAYLRAIYDAELSEIDNQLGLLIQAIQQNPQRKTLLIVTGTHAEALYDENQIAYSNLLTPAELLVPVIFYAPNIIPSGYQRLYRMEQVDLLPTLASLTGSPIPDQAQGRDCSILIFGHHDHAWSPVFTSRADAQHGIWQGPYFYRSGGNRTGLRVKDFNEDMSPKLPLATRALQDLLSVYLAYNPLLHKKSVDTPFIAPDVANLMMSRGW